MDTKVIFVVDQPEALLQAVLLAQNAFLPTYEIQCLDTGNMFGPNVIDELGQGVEYVHQSMGDFARAQRKETQYTFLEDPFRKKASVNICHTYFCNAKETNDVRCVAAEIAEILKEEMGEKYSVEKVISVYQRWINRFFHYQNTGSIDDHSAIGLLQNRTGVCQSIAALTLLILPYFGIPVFYVCGNGKGGPEWGPHGWNIIRTKKGWVHVDFTFGMRTLLTPGTGNLISRRLFVANHQWDEEAYHEDLLENAYSLQKRLQNSCVCLYANKDSCVINGVLVNTQKPLLVEDKEGKSWIYLYQLLHFFGGACEYLPKSNALRICLAGREWMVEQAGSYLGGPKGYVESSILSVFTKEWKGDEEEIEFTLSSGEENEE